MAPHPPLARAGQSRAACVSLTPDPEKPIDETGCIGLAPPFWAFGLARAGRRSGRSCGARAARGTRRNIILSSRPSPPRRKPGLPCCGMADRRWMRRSPRKWCSPWWNRNPPASAAGAYLIVSDGTALQAYDGRETAPASARPDMFLDTQGKPRRHDDAVPGGLSVGVPGAVRMLAMAHAAHGKLAWATLFEPAIRLAEQGLRGPAAPGAGTGGGRAQARRHAGHSRQFLQPGRHADQSGPDLAQPEIRADPAANRRRRT